MDDADAAQLREDEQRDRSIAAIRLRATLDRWQQGVEPRDCTVCTDPIPKERLKAVPGATRCTPCQEAYERTMRMRRIS